MMAKAHDGKGSITVNDNSDLVGNGSGHRPPATTPKRLINFGVLVSRPPPNRADQPEFSRRLPTAPSPAARFGLVRAFSGAFARTQLAQICLGFEFMRFASRDQIRVSAS
jgi:hypothetical protein